jgi:DNA-directed RNA polymerase subunit RPC12/RpoP/Zn-finger nucleic acid-binding protein
MFNIERTDNDQIIMRKKGLRGRRVSFDRDTLDKLIDWLSYGGRAKFSSHSLQVYREGNSLVLHGLEDSGLTIRKKDIPALLVALNSIASTKLPDELAPEPSTSFAEKTAEEETSKLFDERQVDAKEHTLIQTVIPTNVHVCRIAYIQCAGCQTEIHLEHRDSYAGQALQCPQCSQIIILED